MEDIFNDFADFLHDHQDTYEFMTRKLASKLLGKNRNDFRANTTFSRRSTKWWEAGFYRVEHEIPVFLPTNLPRVSYLDLEQHSHVFPEETRDFIDLIIEADKMIKDWKHDPFISDTHSDCQIVDHHMDRVKKTRCYMEETHYNLVKYTLDLEYHHYVHEKLKSHWDVTRFKRLMDYCLGQNFLGPEVQTKAEMIMDLLVTHCTDNSVLVVQVLTDICKRFQADDLVFLDSLPCNLVQFCGKHLKRLGEDFNSFLEEWFQVEDPMIHAICDGTPWKVKRLVQWEFPSTLLPFAVTPSMAQIMKGAWPREKGGVELQSYNSIEYLSMLTTFLANCVMIAIESWFGFSKLRTGFRTFWQSVPIPHIPLADMSACLHYMCDTHHDRLPFAAEELQEILDILQKLLTDEDEYCNDVYAPRSLQHLCRFTIRRSCPTPEGIATLPVADKLKPYLRLDIPNRSLQFRERGVLPLGQLST